VEQMASGYSLAGLAGFFRVSKETIYEWIARHSEFADAVKIGRVARTRFHENKLNTTQVGVGVTAAIFGLKNSDPDEWRDVIHSERTITHNIKQLTTEELHRIAARALGPQAPAQPPALIELNPKAKPKACDVQVTDQQSDRRDDQ